MDLETLIARKHKQIDIREDELRALVEAQRTEKRLARWKHEIILLRGDLLGHLKYAHIADRLLAILEK